MKGSTGARFIARERGAFSGPVVTGRSTVAGPSQTSKARGCPGCASALETGRFGGLPKPVTSVTDSVSRSVTERIS